MSRRGAGLTLPRGSSPYATPLNPSAEERQKLRTDSFHEWREAIKTKTGRYPRGRPSETPTFSQCRDAAECVHVRCSMYDMALWP